MGGKSEVIKKTSISSLTNCGNPTMFLFDEIVWTLQGVVGSCVDKDGEDGDVCDGREAAPARIGDPACDGCLSVTCA